jgi:hypothetical protein
MKLSLVTPCTTCRLSFDFAFVSGLTVSVVAMYASVSSFEHHRRLVFLGHRCLDTFVYCAQRFDIGRRKVRLIADLGKVRTSMHLDKIRIDRRKASNDTVP